MENGIIAFTNIVIRNKNRLKITCRGDLQLNPAKLKPHIENILEKHQTHPFP